MATPIRTVAHADEFVSAAARLLATPRCDGADPDCFCDDAERLARAFVSESIRPQPDVELLDYARRINRAVVS